MFREIIVIDADDISSFVSQEAVSKATKASTPVIYLEGLWAGFEYLLEKYCTGAIAKQEDQVLVLLGYSVVAFDLLEELYKCPEFDRSKFCIIVFAYMYTEREMQRLKQYSVDAYYVQLPTKELILEILASCS